MRLKLLHEDVEPLEHEDTFGGIYDLFVYFNWGDDRTVEQAAQGAKRAIEAQGFWTGEISTTSLETRDTSWPGWKYDKVGYMIIEIDQEFKEMIMPEGHERNTFVWKDPESELVIRISV